MHTEDVLRATGTGLWRWDSETGASTVDVLTAELLGVPFRRGQVTGTERSVSVAGPGSDAPSEEAGPGPPQDVPADDGTLTLAEPSIRSRIHFADYVELTETATLALAEFTLVVAVMLFVD